MAVLSCYSLYKVSPLRTEHAVARGPDGRTQRAAFVKKVKIGIKILILCISINRLYITVRSFRSVLSIAQQKRLFGLLCGAIAIQ